jgi:hypothetical protein
VGLGVARAKQAAQTQYAGSRAGHAAGTGGALAAAAIGLIERENWLPRRHRGASSRTSGAPCRACRTSSLKSRAGAKKKMRVSWNSYLRCLSSSCHADRRRESFELSTQGHPSYTGCTRPKRAMPPCRRPRGKPALDEAKHCRSGAGSALRQSPIAKFRMVYRARARGRSSGRPRDNCR